MVILFCIYTISISSLFLLIYLNYKNNVFNKNHIMTHNRINHITIFTLRL